MANHHHHEPSADEMGSEFWNATYSERPTIWSGRPNAQLVAEAADLPPGSALDVGCGEGADAVWLAQRGWDVTAVDISSVAIDRAHQHAHSSSMSPIPNAASSCARSAMPFAPVVDFSWSATA